MQGDAKTRRRFCILSGLSGITGVVLLGLSFAINDRPPANLTNEQLREFGK